MILVVEELTAARASIYRRPTANDQIWLIEARPRNRIGDSQTFYTVK